MTPKNMDPESGSPTVTDHGKLFRLFFGTYLWLGIFLLLLVIIAQQQGVEKYFLAAMFLQFFEAFAIAIIVASIFSYTLGTAEFVSKVSQLLQDIVISRQFLGGIPREKKEEAFRSLLQPTDLERKRYSNIESFYDNHISLSMSLGDKAVRSNYTITATVESDKKVGRIRCHSIYNYRLYRSKHGFQPIVIGFDDDDPDGRCRRIAVNRPDGERKVYDEDRINELFDQDPARATHKRRASLEIEDFSQDPDGKYFDHLDITIDVFEYGEANWMMITFQALQPTDGFRFQLTCENGLHIQKHVVFQGVKNYYVDQDGTRELFVSCHQWIDEGTGLATLVSYEDRTRRQGEQAEAPKNPSVTTPAPD